MSEAELLDLFWYNVAIFSMMALLILVLLESDDLERRSLRSRRWRDDESPWRWT